jgi:hypothetical protein
VAEEQRERIGPFVVTTEANLEPGRIVCAMCRRLLASLQPDGSYDPTPELLVAAGRVPVPNFGWFCDQKGASDYEKRFGVRFQRDARGNVAY